MPFLPIAAMAVQPQMAPSITTPLRYRAWQWQRAIQPAAGAPADEQCVVLDADLYAAAAPGLRDVRLVQNGREVAYALQESYDEQAPHSTFGADRALYTTVLRIHLRDAGRLEEGTAVLQQHVPVERIELIATSDGPAAGVVKAHPADVPVHVRLVATPITPGAASPRQAMDSEVIEDDLDGNSPVERTAIGANLQRTARIDLGVDPGKQHFAGALLQMHQRSLCYQPLDSTPLLLLYGNADAVPIRYAYAAHYQPRFGTLPASLGPAERNRNYQPRAVRAYTLTRRQRLALAACIAIAGFLLTAVPLLRTR